MQWTAVRDCIRLFFVQIVQQPVQGPAFFFCGAACTAVPSHKNGFERGIEFFPFLIGRQVFRILGDQGSTHTFVYRDDDPPGEEHAAFTDRNQIILLDIAGGFCLQLIDFYFAAFAGIGRF